MEWPHVVDDIQSRVDSNYSQNKRQWGVKCHMWEFMVAVLSGAQEKGRQNARQLYTYKQF